MDDSQSQTWRDLDAIPRAYRIYLVNYEELARKLRVLDDPGQWLPIISVGSGALIPFLQEVERLLHNFLAAAFTLSSTINAAASRRWSGDTRKWSAFEKETPFRRPGAPAFVFGLRNLAQHDIIPLTSSQASAQRNPDGNFTLTHSIILDSEALLGLEWDKRHRSGRQYLDELGHDPDLRKVIESFTHDAVTFTAWFYDQIADEVALLPPERRRQAKTWRASIDPAHFATGYAGWSRPGDWQPNEA
jgi:hypothetical protein